MVVRKSSSGSRQIVLEVCSLAEVRVREHIEDSSVFECKRTRARGEVDNE